MRSRSRKGEKEVEAEHDRPKSSTRASTGGGWVKRRNHADIKRPTALRALSAVEANEKWWPYSPDLPTGLSSTLLRFENPAGSGPSLVSVIYEPTTTPSSVLRPSPRCTPPSPLCLYPFSRRSFYSFLLFLFSFIFSFFHILASPGTSGSTVVPRGTTKSRYVILCLEEPDSLLPPHVVVLVA